MSLYVVFVYTLTVSKLDRLSNGFCICNNINTSTNINILVARPKKEESEKATKSVILRLTKNQEENYTRTAKNNGFSRSAWMKKTLDEAVEDEE